ncbi:MAG: hypothetical protein AAF215_13045 [Cyanobacteria bacterium P01_A01_bin.123]
MFFLSKTFGIRESILFLRTSLPFSLLNLFFLSTFMFLGIYAKLGGGKRGYIINTLFSDFFSDTFPFYGLFTGISDFFWCVAVGICWFTYLFLRSHKVRSIYKRFILSSAILLTIFLADDLFRLTLIFKVFLSVPKLISYLTYGISVVAYGWIYRKILLSTPYILLLIALVLLIISGISDVAKLPGKGTPALLEDGTKMLAILNVCIYYWGICEQTLFRVMYPKSEHRLSTEKKA